MERPFILLQNKTNTNQNWLFKIRANHGTHKPPIVLLVYGRLVSRGHTPAGGILNETTVCVPHLNYSCPITSSTPAFAFE